MLLKLRTRARWVLPVLLGTIAIAYSFYRRAELPYWDGAIGNWVATLLGIVTGVPVALHLERRRAEGDQRLRQGEERKLRNDVAILLQQELSEAKQNITTRAAMTESLPIEPLKMSNWEAMKSTGNLRHISEPALISAVSDAYRLLQCLAETEKAVLAAIHGINVQFGDGEFAAVKLMRNARNFHVPAMSSVDRALQQLESARA